MKKLNKKGFTIVELVIVIAVIAILAAVLIPTYTSVVDKANKSAALQKARNAYTAYLAEHAKDTDAAVDYVKVGEVFYDVDDEFKTVTPTGSYKYIVEDSASTCCGYKVETETVTP